MKTSWCVLIIYFFSVESFSQTPHLMSYGFKLGGRLPSFEAYLGDAKVIKPVIGVYIDKLISTKITGRFGIDYAPYASKDAVPPIIAVETLHYIQSNIKAQYVMGNMFCQRIPFSLGGGVFAGKLMKAVIISHDANQADPEYFKNFSTSSYRPINLGYSVSAEIKMPFKYQDIRIEAEYSSGFTSVYRKSLVPLRLRSITKSFGFSLFYFF